MMAVSYSLIFYQMRSSRLLLEVGHGDLHGDLHDDLHDDGHLRNEVNQKCGSGYFGETLEVL